MKGKGKGDAKNKGGNNPFLSQPPQANVAQPASSSASQAPEKQETAHAEESWSYDYDTYWTDDWSGYESYYGYDGDYSQGDWYNWSYFASSEELTESEDKQSESVDVISEDGQTDKINRFCFSAICLFRFFGHELVEATAFMLLFVSLMYQCFSDLNRSLFKGIRQVEKSVSTEIGDQHSFQPHACPLESVFTEECVFLNYDHGAQQALLCEYVDLGSHPTYVILDSGCTRAMGSRFAIDRLVQACQQHPKRDHIWFSKQPCSSKFSFANGEQSTVKERLVIHFRNDRAQTGWITTCVDILDKGKVPILFSVEQMRNLRMNIEHTPVGEFMTCPLFGMQRTALAVSTSNHPVLDIMALATSSWKPMYSFQSEDITCPACNGKHRPHTNKEGCKRFKGSEPKSAQVPKPAKSDSKKNVKKVIQPDSKLDVPIQPFDPDEEPMVASGPSSGSKDGVPRRREPQIEEETEVKPEPKLK